MENASGWKGFLWRLSVCLWLMEGFIGWSKADLKVMKICFLLTTSLFPHSRCVLIVVVKQAFVNQVVIKSN